MLVEIRLSNAFLSGRSLIAGLTHLIRDHRQDPSRETSDLCFSLGSIRSHLEPHILSSSYNYEDPWRPILAYHTSSDLLMKLQASTTLGLEEMICLKSLADERALISFWKYSGSSFSQVLLNCLLGSRLFTAVFLARPNSYASLTRICLVVSDSSLAP